MELSWAALAGLMGVGLAAGFINMLAGGGSLLTVPFMVFLGLPPTLANGTSRIAILTQNISGVIRYWRAGRLDRAAIVAYAPPTVLGAVAGAWVGKSLTNAEFTKLFVGVVFFAAVVVVVNPTGRLEGKDRTPKRYGWVTLALLGAGFYGGLVQAGVGYVFLAVFPLLGGRSLVEANILKVVMVLCYTPFVLLVYGSAGQLHLVAGLATAVGQSTGAWLGASTALKRGAPWIRIAVAVTATAAGIKLLLS